MVNPARVSCYVALLISLLPMTTLAGARHFTYVYEATTSAPGSIETENWVTWSRTSDPARSDEVGFRHELEFGVTEKLQASVYLADWFYASDAEHSGFTYSDSALELIYNLTNPVIDPIGLSIYEELRAGDRLFELETKIIAQKNLGPWIFAYNATLEAVWEGEGLGARTGEFQQALGVSRQLSAHVSVGAELLHEFVFEDWRDQERIRNLFVGPNISYRHGRWFVTGTALAQTTSSSGEPDVVFRLIFGTGL